ncbi:MAG: hypothetical protein CVU41_11255 [Chloroflexi bacterium HGW-Chloroflexi-3]|nr:MAG: hypothetical protein CVU41_11255 [Chloroflexi bacterium HGW-Chloroflexi-3]
MKNKLYSILILIIFVSTSVISPVYSNFIPVTGEVSLTREAININFQTINFNKFYQFIKNVTAKKSGNQYVGMIVPKLFTLPIAQQPTGRPDFVSNESDVVTEFSLANQFGTTGLLAHNYLAGSNFSKLEENDLIVLVTANKEYKLYKVEKILSYQALSPNSPYSNFVDLNDSSRVLSAVELFMEVYTETGSLVIQTCIAQGNEPSWGRLFVQAFPVTDIGIENLIDFQDQRMRVSF